MKISDSEGSYMDSYEADYTNGDDIFADIHNLDHCIKYLNQSLVTFGFPSGLNLFSSDPVSIAKTCNSIYAMIQQRQRDIEYRETANDTRQRLMSDMSRLEIKMERLSDQLSIKEREMQAMASKEQKVTTAFKTQLEKLQLEKDEFQRMLITTQQVRSQQNHELKKKEKEYVKLQERLNQVLMEKKKESKNGIEIMNLLQKEGRQRGTWNSKKADGDFYKMIVDAYESKKQELVAENADLRALLRSMQADMRDFLNTSNGIGRPGSVANGSADLEPPPTPLGGRTDVFDLPFHMAKDQIEQSLRAKMSTIKERIIQLQGQNGGQTGVSSARELQLEEQLAEARNIINEQATLMTRHIPDSGANSGISKELQQSTEDNSFSSEEATGVQDRNANIEGSRDLSRERTELAKAQQKLAEEQASWASAVTSMAPNLRGHPGLLDSKKQDEPEVAIACRESLINDKEPAESRTATITPESLCILDIPVAFQNSEVESPLVTELADLVPRVKFYENPWLDPLIWEKICAPIENLISQEDHCVQLNNQELKREALDLEPSSVWPKFSFGGLCDPPHFESYEEFEHWIARSAFGGRHDETMVMLQRTQTVAIGSTVSNSESRFTEMA